MEKQLTKEITKEFLKINLFNRKRFYLDYSRIPNMSRILGIKSIQLKVKQPQYNLKTMQAIEDAKTGNGLSEEFDSVYEMFNNLEV